MDEREKEQRQTPRRRTYARASMSESCNVMSCNVMQSNAMAAAEGARASMSESGNSDGASLSVDRTAFFSSSIYRAAFHAPPRGGRTFTFIHSSIHPLSPPML